jgi:hypothetical protein
MKLRKRYSFDFIEWTDCKHIQLLAASADERTWYVEGGARCGVHLLAHFGYKIYTAPRLHYEVLVESAEPSAVRALFRRAANKKSEIGLTTEQSEIQLLEKPDILPGFQFPNWKHSIGEEEPEGLVYPVHKSGWYTKTERVLRLTPPWWAPDAQAFDIREGVYLYFPDGTSRLSRRRDYYRFESFRFESSLSLRRVLARQGDLLFLPNDSNEVFHGWAAWDTSPLGPAEIIDLGRHHIDTGEKVVTHPEHGTMPLPEEPWLAILEPGTSRPFAFAHVFIGD